VLQLPRLVVTSFILICVIALALLAGCQNKRPPDPPLNFAQELPPGEKALRKISPAQYPDFSVMQTNAADLARSIDNSLAYLARPTSRQFFPYLDITHERAVATLRAMREIVASGGNPDWNAEVRRRFEVYKSIGAPLSGSAGGYSGQVLFTGYFTPIYDASLTRQGPYQWPLYKRPADLWVDERTGAAGRRGPDGSIAGPYFTRAEIERDGRLAGQELAWLRTRWEAYVITVQGSGRLRLPDGRLIDVGYSGTNGLAYVSPGRKMVDDGVIGKDQLSFTGLRRYFDSHPESMDKYLWLNPRTIFFTETTGQGIRGSLNVPVTAFASIATDKDVYPRAMPAFVAVPVPAEASDRFGAAPAAGSLALGGAAGDAAGKSSPPPAGTVPFRGFLLDQDTGGAIRAAGRCDLYMGVGPMAEQMAGHQLYSGQRYYLAIRPELVTQSASAAARGK
jgi:peptidoglycan lytic transglycosylase A